MRASPFYFEIKDLIAQFLTAFDDVVIRRYNINRAPQDRINVRYTYAPKQRVLADITNPAQNITLPAIAVSISSITRDNSRVFNKLEGGTYANKVTGAVMKMPVPIDIAVDLSIITKFQTDMEQILSNFVPYSNPYIVISWPVPRSFNLPDTQEIRSPVIWSGDISLEYPMNLTGADKERLIANTSFIIKGWLFKEQTSASDIIYYIKENFHAVDLHETLTYGVSAQTESFELSGSPSITSLFYNTVRVDEDVSLSFGTSGQCILEGYNFNLLDGLMLSSNNTTMFTSLTTANVLGRQPQQITGQLLPYTVVNDNIITFNLPVTHPNFRFPTARATLVVFNKAGAFNSSLTYTLGSSAISTQFIYS